MKKVSLKDIARLARVAPSTVSLVLNGKAKQMRISDTLAERVTAVANKMGYQPNQVAVSLRTGKSKIIGLIAETISGHFFGSLAKIIEDEAEKHQYKVVYCSTENDPEKGQELIRMLSQRQVDGYLITPAAGMEKAIVNLIAHHKPVVLLDSYFPGLPVPYVLVDNYKGVKTGIEHLIKKGYRQIGFVTVDLPLIQVSLREKAYLETMKLKKLVARKKQVLRIPFHAPREAALRQIRDFIRGTKLDAVFFTTNYLGILGLECIRALGLEIPQDLAVVCFDDHDIFRLYTPAITVIQQPAGEIASTAIRILLEQLENEPTASAKLQVQIEGTLLERGSVRQR